MSRNTPEVRELKDLVNHVKGELPAAGSLWAELSRFLSRIDLSQVKIFVFDFRDLGRRVPVRSDIERSGR